MNSPTIMMERDHALKLLEQYETAARVNPSLQTGVDRAVAKGYKVLAKGGRLIDVNAALKAGGLNLAGIPKLAIGRAHVGEVRWIGYRLKYSWHRRAAGFDNRYNSDNYCWNVPKDTFEKAKIQERDFTALSPYIPLPHRPRHDLSNYFLLWEANWHAAPPIDPYLLRPITGALMEIVAEWNLTDLELAAVNAARH